MMKMDGDGVNWVKNLSLRMKFLINDKREELAQKIHLKSTSDERTMRF